MMSPRTPMNDPLRPTAQTATSSTRSIRCRSGEFLIRDQILAGGQRDGVRMIEVQAEHLGLAIVPTRGMGIWQAWRGETRFQWRSPVAGPVHPWYVPISEPSGLGWLSGFDELLVRCGLESNGAPEFSDQGSLRYPLHGRIANLPAEEVSITVDESADLLFVEGTVRESRLFFSDWLLRTTIAIHLTEPWVTIEDTVVNHSDQRRCGQMLYHINLGSPLLGPGARLVAPYERVVPKTPRSGEGIEHFDCYGPPEPGFAEQVYLMQLQRDPQGWSKVLLHSADQSCGVGLGLDTSTLPYFVQWKNTGGLADGYVTGLEPATNFPNTRSFEERAGRVFQLDPQHEITFRLQLHFLLGQDAVGAFAAGIEDLRSREGIVEKEPRGDWCQ